MEALTHHAFTKRLTFLLFVTSVSSATTWLPFIRGISDGLSYQWGATFYGKLFAGKGVTGDFYFVVINLMLVTLLMYSIYWIRDRRICYGLLIIWYGSILGNLGYEVMIGERYMFHGDTLNVHVDLTYFLVPVFLLPGAFVVYMIREDRKHSLIVKRHRKNRLWAMFIVLPIPLQVVLFYSGPPHGISDQVGVVIALLQAGLAWKIFKGYDLVVKRAGL